MNLSNIIIILSRPSEPGNVGAVCRAMKTMGFHRLRVVEPDFSWLELKNSEKSEETIVARAVHAADVWEGAERFSTLAEAVKDCSLVIGTTRRRGRNRKQVSMTPKELAEFLQKRLGEEAASNGGQIGLVFGNERTGLDDEEIGLCNLASHIPVDEAFPSLNLSHAVQIYTYELFLALSTGGAVKGQWVPLTQEKSEELVQRISGELRLLGFYKQAGREEQERFFRDLFSRSALSEREGIYFADLITRAVRLSQKT
ncbi:MAG: RNA methyltransferase [Treponema sp.]|nr:RNA methyltransferase [Treponema sp.]